MTSTPIRLDPAHPALLRSLAETTGKPADEVVQDGLDLLADNLRRLEDRRRVFDRVAGLWKDRDDLPDWEELRGSLDRADRLWEDS